MNRALLLSCAFLCGFAATAAQAQNYNSSSRQIANLPQGVTRNYRQNTPQSYSPSTNTTGASNNGFDMSSFSTPNGANLYPNQNSYTPSSTQPLNTVNQAAVRSQISTYNPINGPTGDPLSGVETARQKMDDGSFFVVPRKIKM